MKLDLILLLIPIASFVIYVGWVIFKYGILPSISHSSYKHNKPWLFFTFMSLIGLPIILMNLSALANVAGVLFIICGCSPYFHTYTAQGNDNKFESILHSIGAEGGIVLMLAHLWVVEHQFYWALVVLVPTFFMTRFNTKNHTWWIEILSFFAVGTGLLYNLH